MSQSELSETARVRSVDIIRGAVMVLMAIDHVRVYSGLPAGGPDAGIFFTRWVTHFCAPAFVFFAGTSAFFYGKKTDASTLARYLVTNDSAILDEAYQTFRGIFPRVPYVTEDYIKSVLALSDNPKAASANPKDFMDNRFLKEIEDSGFVQELYARR